MATTGTSGTGAAKSRQSTPAFIPAALLSRQDGKNVSSVSVGPSEPSVAELLSGPKGIIHKVPSAAPAIKTKNETLKRLGIENPKEALLCLPDSYIDTCEAITVIPDESDQDRHLYNLRFTGEMHGYDKAKKELKLDNSSGWANTFRLKICLVDDDDNKVTLNVFGNPWPYRGLVANEFLNLVGRIVFWGSGDKANAQLQDAETPPSHAIGKIWVKYLGVAGRVSGEKVEAQVLAQLDNPDSYRHCATKLIGALGMNDKEALEAAGASEFFESFEQVIRALHFPEDTDQGWMAKTVANKLAAMAVQAAALRHNLRHNHPDAPLSVHVDDIEILARTQKETLTKSQLAASNAIAIMLRTPKPMNALLIGDVGTGKTLAYLLPAVAAHRAGAQVAIIAPTSILADQIAKQIITRFSSHIKGVERIVAGGLINDHASILVGTPGITSVAAKSKYIPNLLICDEQHKLPTAVREKLVSPWTHTLEVSATPIPRSLASALFGGKDILNLDECPVDKDISCEFGDVTMRPRFVAMIKYALENGNRAAVIYPRVNASVSYIEIEEGEIIKQEMMSVLSGAAALEKAFPGMVVSIHGGMNADEIKMAIEAVRSGEKPLVVASTVIETGVDIPGITCMVVRDADYFGISQLHQLRGRLARTGGKADFCLLVSPKNLADLSEDGYSRMNSVCTIQNGYLLSEIDLQIRGIGDMGSINSGMQSGATTETVFKLVKLRPEDFLKRKLSRDSIKHQTVDLSSQRKVEREAAEEQAKLRMQPRLFA